MDDTNVNNQELLLQDILALKEYAESMKSISDEVASLGRVTPEEWDDFFSILKETGKFPEKYRGRIGESDIFNLEISSLKDIKELDNIPEEKAQEIFCNVREEEVKKAYYDIYDEEYNKKIHDLNNRFSKVIRKLFHHLLSIQYHYSNNSDSNNSNDILDIINNLLEDPKIKKIIAEEYKEASAKKLERLPPLASAPNGDSINFLFRITALSGNKNGRKTLSNPKNRHEYISISENGNKLIYTKDRDKDSQITVTIEQADKYFSNTNKLFSKILSFALQKMTAQNFPLEVGFSLQELVELEMYSNTSNAARAIKDFFERQKLITLGGSVKKGKKTIKEAGGILFYNYIIDNGYVTFSVNEKFNMEFLAPYYTIFPRFAYSLKINSFLLIRYIFFIARQRTKDIKDNHKFKIKLDSIRDAMGLPPVDDVKNRKYKQYIMDPIEEAIENIEEKTAIIPEAKNYSFTLTLCGTDTNNIKEWLAGYLEIGLDGDFANTFIQLAEKTEKEQRSFEKIKTAELAKIAARSEASQTIQENIQKSF